MNNMFHSTVHLIAPCDYSICSCILVVVYESGNTVVQQVQYPGPGGVVLEDVNKQKLEIS